MNKHFLTNDINLAAALTALGIELVKLDRTNSSRVQFIFYNEPGLDKTIESFWNNSLTLPAQQLLATQRQLKNRIYAEKLN